MKRLLYFKKSGFLSLLFSILMLGGVSAQSYWAASGGYVLNVDTGETFAGSVGVRGALTEAHDDADTQDGHTLMFMPAGLDIYSTDVFDTDHDYSIITKEITIDGNGATVSNDNPGSNTSAAIWLQPTANITQAVRNITLCGFTHTNGSALKNNDATGSKIILENVNVYYSGNNSYAVWLEGSCDVINCDISNVQQTSNTGGLNVVLNNEPETVNIINSTFNCNRKDGFGSSVAITDPSATYYAHTVNISGGSMSYNVSNYHPFHLGLAGGSIINLSGMSFLNNKEQGTGAEANVIYHYDPGSGTTTLNVSDCVFVNNTGNEDIIKGSGSGASLNLSNSVVIQGTGNTIVFDNSPGSAIGNVIHGAFSFDGGSTSTTQINSTSTFDVGSYYVPGYSYTSSCGGICTPSLPSQAAQISFGDCLAPSSTLTSTESAEWFYQQSGSAPVSLGVGLTATIPSGLSGYTVFWQDVATGSDPIIAGVVEVPAVGTNTNTAPAEAICLGSIEGNVFQDGDATAGSADGANGTGPVADTNLSGVTVSLYDSNTMALVATTTTDANGNYEFYNIPDGDYYVEVTTPAGMVSTTLSNTAGPAVDSDPATAAVLPGAIVTSPTITIDVNPDASALSNDDSFLGPHITGLGIGFVLDPVALPVELASFYVKNMDCNANLYWTTLSEENASHFEVEKSDNGRTFETVGRVAAAGNSAEVINYSFDDGENRKAAFYRLRMVDLDGSFEYSNVIAYAVDNCGKSVTVQQVYPSPVKETLNVELNLSLDAELRIKVIDMTGRILIETERNFQEGFNNAGINVSGLGNGIYYLQITTANTNEISNVKFVKM